MSAVATEQQWILLWNLIPIYSVHSNNELQLLSITQACRGQQLDGGVVIGVEETDAAVYGIPDESRVKIPSEADFLVGYSSPPGTHHLLTIFPFKVTLPH